MIADFETDSASYDCDICIVGGGAVGLALAVTLADAGGDVLVLEGGGETLESRSQTLQQGGSVGRPFPNIGQGRYRVLGGTTTFWGGQVLPIDDSVTSGRDWLGHAAWPLQPRELHPYFQRAYALLGLDVDLEDESVWGRLGIARPDFGNSVEMMLTHWVKVRNFTKLFGKKLGAPTGPRVLTHANVVAIRLRDDRKSVRSAVIRSLTGKTAEVTARRFVLAAGTLEIARLLLLPLADGSAATWSDSPHLGRPLIDHLDVTAGEVKVIDHRRFHALFDSILVGGHRYYPKLRLSPGVQRQEGLVDAAALFLYRSRYTEHMDYLKMFVRSLREGGLPIKMRTGDHEGGHTSILALPGHVFAVASASLPLLVRYFRDRRSFKPNDAEVSLRVSCEQLPTDRSCIRLGQQTDALGLCRLEVDWQIDGRELRTIRRFALLIKEQLETRGLAEVTLDPRLLDLDPTFIDEMSDAIHQMGCTRMAATAADGFVDPDLKVFGVDNLFLAGATVFPDAGAANPTFTAIALALRLGDHLLKADAV